MPLQAASTSFHMGKPSGASHRRSAQNDILQAVRSATQRAQRHARVLSEGGKGSFSACVDRVYDEWIGAFPDRDCLIAIASAAEMGVLKAEHLRIGAEALKAVQDRRLHMLFWAAVRRWRPIVRPIVRQGVDG